MAHLLLIDDDPALLPGQVRQAFPAPAHRVEVAASGAAGLERIGARPPDVILLDLGLPDQSGLELACRIHRSRWSAIPIVAMSASPTELQAARDSALFVAFLSKPFSIDELSDTVQEHLAA